ncbi:hypothetical protein BG004_008419 [Podila humilis]|nr:hypothetical protein BG004_008419 [Podila humilis]
MFFSLKDRLSITTLQGTGSGGVTPATNNGHAISGSLDTRLSSDSANGSGNTVAAAAAVQVEKLHDTSTSNSSTNSTTPPPPPSSQSSFVSRISTAAAGLSVSSGLPSSSIFRRPLQASASRSSSDLLGHLNSFHSSGSTASSSPLSPGAKNWSILVQKLTLDPINEPADPAQLEKVRGLYRTATGGDSKQATAESVPATPTTPIPEAVIEKLEVLQRYESRFPGEDRQLGIERRKSTSEFSSSSSGSNADRRGPGGLNSSRRPSILLAGFLPSSPMVSSDLANAFKRIVQEKVAIETILRSSTPIEDLSDVEALEAHLQNMSTKSEMSSHEIRRLSDELREFEKLKKVHELEAESQASMIENLQEQLSEATQIQSQALSRELEMIQYGQELQRQLTESKRQAEESLKETILSNEKNLKDVEESLEKAHQEEIGELRSQYNILAGKLEEAASALVNDAQRHKEHIERLEGEYVALKSKGTLELAALQEEHNNKVQELQTTIQELSATILVQEEEQINLNDRITEVALDHVATRESTAASPTLTNHSTDDPAIQQQQQQQHHPQHLHDKIFVLSADLLTARNRELELIAQLERAHQFTPPPQSPQPVDSPEQLMALKQEREELSKKLDHLERVHQGTERDSQEKVKSYEQELKLLLEQKSRLEAQVQEKSEQLQQEQDRVAYEIERVTLELTAVKTAERFASSKVTELSKDRDQVIEKVVALEGRLERLKECKHGQEQSLTSQIEVLSQEKMQMLEVIQTLEAEQAKTMGDMGRIRVELETARTRAETSEARLKEFEFNTANAVRTSTSSDIGLSELQERLASVTSELETRGLELIRVESQLSALQESSTVEISELSANVQILTAARDHLQSKETSLTSEIQELRITVEETTAHLAEKQQLLQLLEQDNNLMSKSKTESQEKVDELQTQLRAVATHERDLKESLELAKDTIHQRDQDLGELQKTNENLGEGLLKSTTLLKATQQQIKKLEKDKQRANEEVDVIKLSLLNAQQEIKSLTDKSTAKANNLSSDLKKVQDSLAKTEKEREDLVKDKNSHQDQIQRLEAEMKSLQSTIDNSETQLQEYKRLLTDSQDRVDTLEELTSIARRVAETKVVEYEAMVARVTELESSLDQATEEIEQIKISHDEKLEESKKKAEKVIVELEVLVNAGEEEIGQLREIQEEHVAMIQDLEQQRDLQKERLETLLGDIVRLSETKEQLELSLNTEKSLVQDQKALEQQAEESKNRETHLRTVNKTLKDEVRKLQKQIPGYSPQPSPSLHSPYTSGFPATPMPGNNNNSSNSNAGASASGTGTGGPRAMSMSSLMTPPNTPRFSRPLFQNHPDEDVNIEYLKNVMLSFMEYKERRTTALLGNLSRQNVTRQLMPLSNSKNSVITLSQRTSHAAQPPVTANAPRSFSSSQASRDNNNSTTTTHHTHHNSSSHLFQHYNTSSSAFAGSHSLGHTAYLPPSASQRFQSPLAANLSFRKDSGRNNNNSNKSIPRYSQISKNAWDAINGQDAQAVFPFLQEMRREGYYADTALSTRIVAQFLDMNSPKDAERALAILVDCHHHSTALSVSQRNTYTTLAKDIANHSTGDISQALSIAKLLDRHGLLASSGLADGTLRSYRQLKTTLGLEAVKRVINSSSDVETLLTLQSLLVKTSSTQYKHLIEILLDAKEMNMVPSQESCSRVSASFMKLGDFTGQLAWDTAVQEIYPGYKASSATMLEETESSFIPANNQRRNSNNNNNNTTTTTTSYHNKYTAPSALSNTSAQGLLRHGAAAVGGGLANDPSEAIIRACRFGYATQALDQISAMIQDNQIPSPQAIADTIQVCAKREKERKTDYRQLFELAQKSLDNLSGSGNYNINNKTVRRQAEYEIFNAMLVANATLGDMKAAKKNYDDIVQLGQFPDATGYATLLIATTTGAVDEANDALRILEEVKRHNIKPNIFFYNVVIGKLSRGRKIERVLEIYEEMVHIHRIRPNAITYGTLISACTRVGSEEMAKNLFQEMVTAANYHPRHGPHNAMIQFYVRQKKDRTAALKYYEDMLQRRLVPTEHTYTLLIEAHACIQPYDLSEANRLIQSLSSSPSSPSSPSKRGGGASPMKATESHYGALIHAYGVEHRDLSTAEAVFERMSKTSGIIPKGPAYQSLIESYITAGQVPKAVELRNRLLTSGQTSSAYIENTLIRGYGQTGDIKAAEQIFEAMQDPHGFDGATDHNNKTGGNTTTATTTINSSNSKNGGIITKEPSTYQSMVNAYLENGQVDKALETLSRMRRQHYPELVVKPVEEAILHSTAMMESDTERMSISSASSA